jgi:hypothetical protein
MTPQQADALIGMLTDTVQAQQAQIETLQHQLAQVQTTVADPAPPVAPTIKES